jgi:hypothetical protein
MDLQAVTGQIYIIDGEAQTEAAVPGLLAQPAPAKAARGRGRDFLFVHLSLSGPAAETASLTHDLVEFLSNCFYQCPGGSVTGALRKAIGETNELLLRWNLGGTGRGREGALTCAVLRGEELFVAQVGEALALVGHNFGVERLPPRKPDRITPLGQTAGIDVRYFHTRLQAGDMLLLADPRLGYLSAESTTAVLVETDVESGLAELATLVGADSARLLLVEFCDEAGDYVPEVGPPVRQVESKPALTPLAAQPQRSTPSGGSRAAATAAGPHAPVTRLAQLELPTIDPARVETGARQATSSAARAMARVVAAVADVMTLAWPPQTREEAEAQGSWAWPALSAVVIPVIVTLIVSGVYFQRGQVMRFTEIKQEMNQNLGLAAQDGGANELARPHYVRVLALAEEADAIRQGDSEIGRLRNEARAGLDRLDGITRLRSERLYQYEPGTQLTAVVLRPGYSGGIFTLDGARSLVYYHESSEDYLGMTGERPLNLLFPGQVVGSHVVNQIIDIVWRPQGLAISREGLAMLDRGGAAVTYFPNLADTRATALGFASDWREPTAATTFSERLYILDRGAREVWKYFADGEGFILKDDDRTIRFLENPQLNEAVDVAIYSEDGSVVVLYGDGRLRRFVAGRLLWSEVELQQNGLDLPLVAPTAVKIIGRGLNASIFVADPGSGRILQFSLGGILLAQYQATDANGRELFSQIHDFDVAQAPLRIITGAGNILYAAHQ